MLLQLLRIGGQMAELVGAGVEGGAQSGVDTAGLAVEGWLLVEGMHVVVGAPREDGVEVPRVAGGGVPWVSWVVLVGVPRCW